MNENDETTNIGMEFVDECGAMRRKSAMFDSVGTTNWPDHNMQNVTVNEAIQRLIATIEASDMPILKKQEVKNELKRFIEHPIVSSRISDSLLSLL